MNSKSHANHIETRNQQNAFDSLRFVDAINNSMKIHEFDSDSFNEDVDMDEYDDEQS